MGPLIAPALRKLAGTHPAIMPAVSERYGPAAVADLRRGDLDIVLTEYDAGHAPPREPGLARRRLAFDPYVLIVPPDWAIIVHRPADLRGRPRSAIARWPHDAVPASSAGTAPWALARQLSGQVTPGQSPHHQ